MTSADVVVLAVMILSGLVAFMRGLVREVLSIVAWLGAALVAWKFKPVLVPYLGWMPQEWTDPAAYIVIFLVSLIVFSIVASTISGAVRSSAVGGIDRTLGLAFGLARGVVLAIVAYIVGGLAIPPERWPEQVLDARSLPLIYQGAEWLARQVPEEYRPKVETPPAPRQPALNSLLSASPTGRAIDPPPRR
jgi:membrane protein required for colicin V production